MEVIGWQQCTDLKACSLPDSVHKVPVNLDESERSRTGGMISCSISVRAHQMLCKDQDLVIPKAGIGRDRPTLPVTFHPEKIQHDWDSEKRSFHFSVFALERSEEMMEGKQRQTEALDEFYILCLVMNDLWEIYSRLNMHRGWGVNSLIHGRRNIQGCTYMGTGLWNETNSVNVHWKTASFNLRLFMGKRFYQLVRINTVVWSRVRNKSCETLNFKELWCHMRPWTESLVRFLIQHFCY